MDVGAERATRRPPIPPAYGLPDGSAMDLSRAWFPPPHPSARTPRLRRVHGLAAGLHGATRRATPRSVPRVPAAGSSWLGCALRRPCLVRDVIEALALPKKPSCTSPPCLPRRRPPLKSCSAFRRSRPDSQPADPSSSLPRQPSTPPHRRPVAKPRRRRTPAAAAAGPEPARRRRPATPPRAEFPLQIDKGEHP
jgi:hypothetical protein